LSELTRSIPASDVFVSGHLTQAIAHKIPGRAAVNGFLVAVLDESLNFSPAAV